MTQSKIKNKIEIDETIMRTSDKFLEIDLWSVVYFLDLCFNILIVFDHRSLTLRLNIVAIIPRWMTFDCKVLLQNSTFQIQLYLRHLQILRFHESHAWLAHFRVHQVQLASTDGCIYTVVLFEPSKRALFSFRTRYQKYLRRQSAVFAENI